MGSIPNNSEGRLERGGKKKTPGENEIIRGVVSAIAKEYLTKRKGNEEKG